MLRSGRKPARVDRVARFLAQALVPVVMLSGIPAWLGRGRLDWWFHFLPSLLIILLVPAHFFLRRFLLKSRRLPWLLPGLNFLLLLIVLVSGLGRWG